MTRTLASLLPLAVLGLAACSGGGGDETPTADTGFGSAMQFPHCEDTVTDVALDEATELGFAPAALVELADGVHLGPLTWADGTVTDATITATLQGSRFVDSQAVYPTTGTVADIGIVCEDRVEVDGTLTMSTADGRLAETLTVVFQSADGVDVGVRTEVDPGALSGSLVFDDFVRAPAYDERSMFVDVHFDAAGSRGQLDGQVTGGDDCADGEACTQWAEVVDIGTWGYELD